MTNSLSQILDTHISLWKGFLVIGFISGFIAALFFFVSHDMTQKLFSATTVTEISNQATATFKDASGKSYGPVASNSAKIQVSPVVVPDTIPPSSVTDLAVALSPTIATTFELSWTAPGDDSKVGTAKSYDIRFSTQPITQSNWASAQKLTSIPTPQIAGSVERVTVSNLKETTMYYFALQAADDANNVSALSNVVSATTGSTQPKTDTTPPAKIVNFTPSVVANTSIEFIWKAPGDDGTVGTATSYQIRYSTQEIKDDATWNTATVAPNPPLPAPVGTAQTYTLSNLVQGTLYYAAIKATDDASNTSSLSNMVRVQTTGGTPITDPTLVSQIEITLVPEGKYQKNFQGILLRVKDTTTQGDLLELTGDSNTSGVMTVAPNNLQKATYDIMVKVPKTLSRIARNQNLSQSTTFTISNILIGNLQDSDDSINSLDWAVMSAQWGTNDAFSDLNKDLLVNSLDWSVMNKNWAQKGDASS